MQVLYKNRGVMNIKALIDLNHFPTCSLVVNLDLMPIFILIFLLNLRQRLSNLDPISSLRDPLELIRRSFKDKYDCGT